MAVAAKKQTIGNVSPEAQQVPNSGTQTELAKLKQEKLSLYLSKPKTKESLLAALRTEKSLADFSARLLSMITNNPAIAECSNNSIVVAYLHGYTLNLSPELGEYYIVPYKNRKDPSQLPKATFQLGWQGYKKLAITSNLYKWIRTSEIKEGELKYYNPITEEVEFEPIQDIAKRNKLKTIAWYGEFLMTNGYTDHILMFRDEIDQHAQKYSKAYNSADSWWKKDFSSMANKTVYRKLIKSKGIMSPAMAKAYDNDMTASEDITGGTKTYIDNPQADEEPIPDPIDVDIIY